jgi:hypothetical protein
MTRMSSDLLSLLSRVARSMESVVPGLELTVRILEPVWLEDDAAQLDEATIASTDAQRHDWRRIGATIRTLNKR